MVNIDENMIALHHYVSLCINNFIFIHNDAALSYFYLQ
jgi:hypothetical protein